jgi:serine phosphatase RsbU (regulator of sigma subunit)/CheY-like chemotaxis protein/anti-sigma regulatory factor (Ser/Thr protein kinase)
VIGDPPPVAAREGDEALNYGPPASSAGPTGQPAGILIVDDHPENLVALTAVLESLGERVVCAGSGDEALRVLLREQFAVILLDVRMGGLDGLQTAQLIRTRPRTRDIPIIFLTAESTDVAEIARAYETTGAVDYLVKPFEPEILRAKVSVLVALTNERAERWRQARARAEAEASTRTIRTLQIISDTALSHLNLEELLPALLRRACAVFGLAGAQLLLRTDSTGALSLAGSAGVPLSLRVDRGVRPDKNGGDPLARAAAGNACRMPAAELAETGRVADVEAGAPIETVLLAPLVADGQRLGLLVLGGSEIAASAVDLELLGLAGERMAIAIDHAQRAAQGRALVETIQRSLLPENLPSHPFLELAARYLPSGAPAEIGGDWYDALYLGPDRVGIMIGDVVGHGIRAATTMSELRSALRAFAIEGHSPSQALHELDRLVQATFGPTMVATALYLVIDLSESSITFARAAHPPPVLLSADGQMRLLETQPSLPLGLAGAAPEQSHHRLAADDTLLVFTDGLIERRGESIDDGFKWLREVLADAPTSIDALCEHVTASAIARSVPRDDIALIALRAITPVAGPLELTLPARPQSVPLARHRLHAWLQNNSSGGELDSAWMNDVELAFSEACTNAVRHAYGTRDATFRATAAIDARWLLMSVQDHGRWQPRREGNDGRGLALIRMISDDMRLDRRADGTQLTIKHRLPLRPDVE